MHARRREGRRLGSFLQPGYLESLASAQRVQPPDEESRVQQLLESNTTLKKAFEKYRAEHSTLDLVEHVRLGELPGSDRERLRAACDLHLGASIQNGLTMDEVLVALQNAGYYDCIDKTPIEARVQLISVNHEVRDHEFLL